MSNSEVNIWNLFIDSDMRDSGTNSECTFLLKQPIILSNPMNHFVMTLKSSTIPFSFKSINSTNNKLLVYSVESDDILLTIPPGNYSVQAILDQIKSLILINCGSTISMIYDPISGFTTYTKLTGSNITFKLTNYPYMAKILGLNATNCTITSTQTISQNHCISYGIKHIFIRSSNLRMKGYEWTYMKSEPTNIIARIPILSSLNTYIQYNDGNITNYILDTIINKIELYISSDNSDENLELYNLGFSVHIEIKEISEEITNKHILNELRRLNNSFVNNNNVNQNMNQNINQNEENTDNVEDNTENVKEIANENDDENIEELTNLKNALDQLGISSSVSSSDDLK